MIKLSRDGTRYAVHKSQSAIGGERLVEFYVEKTDIEGCTYWAPTEHVDWHWVADWFYTVSISPLAIGGEDTEEV